jgi:hypothetical protein
MAELTEDARQTLEAFLAIHTRAGGERQTHTDRAIEAEAGLSSSRVSAALIELTAGGYISASMPPWEGTATLKNFRMNDKGRQALIPNG